MRLFLLAALLLAGCRQSAQSQNPAPQHVDGAGGLEAVEGRIDASRRTAITRAVEAASPAVVSVNVIEVVNRRVRPSLMEEMYYGRRLPDRVYQQEVQAVGSGFIVSADGYIVTNDHVAGNATKITIAFPDGSQLPATLVGSDPETDIALLKVEAPGPLPYLDYETREGAIAGEWAIALGNPFGLFEAAEPSVTVGVVSAVGRDFPAQQGRTFRDMIQTDAAINSGNSGGPLVDALGRVIGMNTFIFSQSGGSVGLGFAVPAWRIEQVTQELRTSGSVDRSLYTGFAFQAVTDRIARILGVPNARGLIVTSVDSDSPAERAGIQPRDVIVSIGSDQVQSNDDVRQLLIDNRAGDSVRLGVVRDGEARNLTLTLASSR